MIVRATEILKAIHKLNSAEKHRLRECLIDAFISSRSTGEVLLELSERKKWKSLTSQISLKWSNNK